MGKAAVYQWREKNAGQPGQLTRPHAEVLGSQVQHPVQQLNEPDQRDKAERDLYRQPEVGPGPLGVSVGRVESVDLHRCAR